jgi:ATP-binding cassette, subfamily B, bacterial
MRHWWLKLGRYAIPQSRALGGVGALMLLGIAAGLLTPWPLKLIVDYVLVGVSPAGDFPGLGQLPGFASPEGQLAWLAAATVVLFLMRRLAAVLQSYVLAGASSRMTYHLASDLFDHVQRRPLSFHQSHRVGDLVKRITSDTTCVRDLIVGVYLPVVTAVITLFSMFLLMWHLDPKMALVAVAMAIPLGIVTRFFAGPMAEKNYEEKQLQGEMVTLAEQSLSALPIVQAFGREDDEEARFRALSQRTVQANLRTALCQQKFLVSTGAVGAVATAAVMLIGGISVLDGEITIGTLLVFMAYFNSLYSPLETLAYLGSGFSVASAGARRVLEVLEHPEDGVQESPEAIPLPAPSAGLRGHVQIQEVTFGYQEGRPVLQEVSLEAQPGEVIALVGHTGAGKSTLVSLIGRFFDPWQGRVVVDGSDIRGIQLESLRQHISIVLQEPFLFPLTVAENIAYGRSDCSHKEIEAAAQAAQAHEFIERLPAGYETVLGERGVNLSGGERQRLAIARAILKDAPILILDEPTSALDAQTESHLLSALEQLMQQRTTFVIAHRFSTIRKADRVIVLENGRVIEAGPPSRLLADGGTFAHLHQCQFGDCIEAGHAAPTFAT